MWFLNSLKQGLQNLGLIYKNAKIVILGLENAGKSALILRLKQDKLKLICSTADYSIQQFIFGNIKFKAWDFAGYENVRKKWKNYLKDIDAIVYVVDLSDHKRLQLSKNLFKEILTLSEEQKVPIIVLGNKTDKLNAVMEDQLRELFGIKKMQMISKYEERPIELFMCSVVKRTGYRQAFEWLSKCIQ